jgi:hypothetical protein
MRSFGAISLSIVFSKLVSSTRLAVLSCVFLLSAVLADLRAVEVPAGINNDDWTALLQKYVDQNGLIDYARWRQNDADRRRLDAYLAQFAQVGGAMATGAERGAGFINAYNAYTVLAVLKINPQKSFWDHKPFDAKLYPMAGQLASLNEIEHNGSRPESGYRVHAALVCAALSCPPLLREAYTADKLDAQLDERMRLWLAMPKLNAFDAKKKVAAVSKIFEWFPQDFDGPGGLPAVLARYAPEEHRAWLAAGGVTVTYLEYDQRLNAP